MNTRLELALSALMAYCEELIRRDQLSHTEQRQLNELIRKIKAVLHDDGDPRLPAA